MAAILAAVPAGAASAASKVYLDEAFSPYESSYIHWSPKVFRG